MKNKMNQFKIIFFLLLLLTILSCGNKKSNIKPDAVNNTVSVPETKTSLETQSESTSDHLEKAKKDGKTVFLVITGTGATGIDKAINVAKEANTKIKESVVIQLNRDQAVNSSLVSKFGIAAVPLPFILVISPKGVPVAGAPSSQVTSDQLIKSIPSSKQDEVFFALSEKTPVFVVVSKKGYSDKAGTIAKCETARSKITTKPTIVEIDFDDNNEK